MSARHDPHGKQALGFGITLIAFMCLVLVGVLTLVG
jgi:hypothetical protein